jgi:type III secretion protein T
MHESAQVFLDILLALARIGTAFLMLPLLGREAISPFARLFLAVPFAYFVVATETVGGFGANWIPLIAKEVAIGMLLGFIWALPFHALETVGHLVDFQTGLTFTQTVNPFLGNEAGITATMVSNLFATLFVIAGGLTLLLDTMMTSYVLWPALSMRPQLSAAMLGAVLYEHNGLFTLALLFVAPVMIILFLVEFATGVISKSAQQLAVDQFVLPLKIWLSWVVLLLSLPYVMQQVVGLIPQLVGISKKALQL